MPRQTLYLWKQAPFLRLLVPFMAGIMLQWYTQLPALPLWYIFGAGIAALIFFNRRISFLQYKWRWINGVFINIILLCTGVLMLYYKDISNQQLWLNNYYQDSDIVTSVLQEPLSEKANSYKAVARVQQIVHNNNLLPVKGNIVVYFKKDSLIKSLRYGSQIVFSKPLQPIRNSGNPGAFDYQRYAAFQGIYQQVFLQPGDYTLLSEQKENWLTRLLFNARKKVLDILTLYIPGEKEAGMAEALLVGYKDDLDKTLVQSYSNTGVVHIIAISGMHLGLIYWLLSVLLKPFKKRKHTRWIVPILTVAGLWLFSLLAGGGPSILRSAVMFSCIAIGESAERKTFIYNSLAASAFILLCINPFWLWDAGFQLSYTAVLSIVIFMKPVYNWFYFENKIIDTLWKLTAVTLAAQVLTTPVSIYHFHQFPVYFLLTNLPAVPLSSLIVLLEIVLCAVSFLPWLATPIGLVLHWLIFGMNSFIEHMEHLPFSTWGSLQLDGFQLLLFYGFIIGISYWFMKKSRPAFFIGMICLLGVFSARSFSLINAKEQQQLIVYNIPKHRAIDFVSGTRYVFKGDSTMAADDVLQNYYLRPGRLLYRAGSTDSISNLQLFNPVCVFNQKTIVFADKYFHWQAVSEKIHADLIVLSENSAVSIPQLMETFQCNQVVLDGSNSYTKVNKWKREAAKLGLHCFCTVDKGAFVMNMD